MLRVLPRPGAVLRPVVLGRTHRAAKPGRSDHRDNLALACQGCNNHKYTRTTAPDPATGAEVVLFHPRLQRWRDHFVWSEDCTEVVGRTPTGRATVSALRLNRPGVVNLRRVLFAAGLHPPPEPI